MDNLPALQPQSPFAEPNQEIDLRRAWATIARSAWIIVVCVGLAVAAAVVAARRVEPRYTAMATVRIEDANRGAGASAAIAYFGGSDYQTTLAVASELITSRSLASEVVDLLGLRLSVALPQRTVRSQLVASAHFLPDAPSVSYRLIKVEGGHEVRLTQPDSLLGVYPDTGELRLIGGAVRLTGEGHALDRLLVVVEPRVNAAEWLRGSVGVDQVNKDANVLSISYRGRDSALVSQLPNAIAHAFVKKRLELDRSGATAQEEYLRKQLATLTADVTEKEQEMRAYLEKEGIPSVGRAEQVLAADLGQLEGQKRELETQRDNIKRAMEPLSDPDTLAARDRFLRRLLATPDFTKAGVAGADVTRLEQLLVSRSDYLTRRLPTDPRVRELDKQINETQESIRLRSETYLSNLDQQITGLAPRIAAVTGKLQKVPQQALEYAKLERDRHIVEEMMTLVQSELKRAEIRAAVQDSTASVLDEAVEAAPQGGSSETLIFVVAVFSGLLVGIAVAFLRDWLDTTVRTEQDLANIVGVAVVGIIPNLQQQARSVGYRLPAPKGGEDRPAAGREYQTPAAEAYRTLRTNLNYLTPPRPPRIIVITSALPGDGKTTTVVNLAITLAHQGQRVILIDAETRRGTVHDVFGIPPGPGFFDLMYGQASPGECIRRVQMEGGGTLDVLPLGSSPSVNPADLLVAGRLQPLFERLRAQYDFVFIDTPPLNLFTDGALIGAHADALLLVARADRTDRDELRFAVQQLRNVQVTLAGTILNDVEFRRSSRYRLGYGYYYDYAR
ncbi:MAG TPA: polysaccharide biosynthesis tyrosine autokinase [Gemmatimonadaceae bacterium]|nr:polysaccharide biosynthesis tyrosine autokinase [Gemmatimonadaceae bacterium]